ATTTNAPFNTIDMVFSEGIAAASVSSADITAFTGPGGSNLLGQITGASVVGGNTLRVTFNSQYAEGDYSLTVSPTLTDLVGNLMNQNANGVNGESGDGYTATVHVDSVDLIAPVVTAPASALWGQQITVSWVGHNNLSAPATANWYDYVILSNNNVLDSSDNYIAYRHPGVQPLAGHTDYNNSVSFTLPLNHTLTEGTYYLFVHSDQGNSQGEADNNNNVSAATPIVISYGTHPDLVVQNLAVAATPQLESGASVAITWNTANIGNGVMNGYFYDRVNVYNVTTSTNLGNWDFWYDGRSSANNIAVGASIARSHSITLPDGPSAVGELRFTVTTDIYSQLFERTTAGVSGDNNNSASVTQTSTLASYADLRVENLIVTPTAPESGHVITIAWNDANHGTNTTEANFYDRVRVINTSTGSTLLDTWQIYNSSTIAAGGTAARSYDFRLPDGPTGVGNLQVIITTDINNNIYEYMAGQTPAAESNNETSTTLTSTLAMYADLQVQNMTVTPATPESGHQVTLDWTDVNTGNLASGGYSNFIGVKNTATDQWLVYTSVVSGAVEAGGSQARSYSFTLPDGNAGVSTWAITITNDWGNNVFEYNAGGTAETNNTGTASTTSVIAAYADLVVDSLSVTPASGLQSGGTLQITWNDLNNGNLAAGSSWHDLVQVVNTRTGQTLLSTTVYHNAGTEGSLAVGGTFARSYDFAMPNGDAGVGDIQVTVTTDYYNGQYEYNTSGTGNTNNSATSTVTSTIAPYADLEVRNLAVTPSALHTGQTMTISWDDTNTGNLAAGSNWHDRIVIVNTTTGQTLLNTTVYHNATSEGNVAAGASLARSYDFALPNGDTGIGDLTITVTADT
ncbi:MAG: Ig-like domain-containing protein, partial [Desulfobulbaceae bacterium]|nr:Ig-like domain-containing protein [Desulfobulbaceae bacterium]